MLGKNMKVRMVENVYNLALEHEHYSNKYNLWLNISIGYQLPEDYILSYGYAKSKYVTQHH